MILRSPTDHENGGFPFVARMEQSVIRVSSFTHAVASATPHVTFLDSASLHPGYNSRLLAERAIYKISSFQNIRSARITLALPKDTKGSDIYALILRELRAFVVRPLFFAPFARFVVKFLLGFGCDVATLGLKVIDITLRIAIKEICQT